MTKDQKRAGLLVGVMGLLVVLVGLDRFGALGGQSDDAEAEGSPREAWLLASAEAGQMQAEVDQGAEWQALLADAQGAWDAMAEELLVAPSAEVAAARLRRRVQEAMSDIGLELSVSEALPAITPIDDEPLRVVGLEISFDSLNPEQVHMLVDRLENLGTLRTNVPTIRIEGPGRSVRTGLQVTMRLQALAIIQAGTPS